MRLGLCINRLSYFNSHRREHAEYFQAQGYEVFVLTNIDTHTEWQGTVVHIPWSSGFIGYADIYARKVIRDAINRYEIQLLHSFSPKPNLVIVSMRLKIPTTYSFNGLGYIGNHVPVTVLYFKLFKILMKQGVTIVAQNESDKNLISNLLKMEVRLVHGSGLSDPKLRSDYSQKTVIVVARLLRSKGILELIEAAQILKNEGSKIEIIVCGGESSDNPEGLNLEECRMRAPENLRFLGLVSKETIYKYFLRSSAFLLPSYREGLSLAAIEAAAFALPLLLTDVAGSNEQVIDSYNGYLIKSKSSIEISTCLIKLESSHDDIERMGRNSRLLFEQKWELDIIMKQLQKIYDEFDISIQS